MSAGPERWRTSVSHPIPFDVIPFELVPPQAGWCGRLGMTHLPGKRGEAFGERHWRTLSADVERLKRTHDVDRLALLVEDVELGWWGALGLSAALTDIGIKLVRHPVVDALVPSDTPSGGRGRRLKCSPRWR